MRGHTHRNSESYRAAYRRLEANDLGRNAAILQYVGGRGEMMPLVCMGASHGPDFRKRLLDQNKPGSPKSFIELKPDGLEKFSRELEGEKNTAGLLAAES